jgi:hypothetical protein
MTDSPSCQNSWGGAFSFNIAAWGLEGLALFLAWGIGIVSLYLYLLREYQLYAVLGLYMYLGI